jgi:hypothetical protein
LKNKNILAVSIFYKNFKVTDFVYFLLKNTKIGVKKYKKTIDKLKKIVIMK